MSSTGRLTMRRHCQSPPSGREQYVSWDNAIVGFGVRVSPAGAQTYILKYRLSSGRVRWATIERVGAITLVEARKHAQRLLGIVADDDDPLRRRDAARDAPTVAIVAARFLEISRGAAQASDRAVVSTRH